MKNRIVESSVTKNHTMILFENGETVNARKKLQRGDKMKKYRKKPIVIEAIKFDGNKDMPNVELKMVDQDNTMGEPCNLCGKTGKEHGLVKTLEGVHIACPGDMIIREISGEHYPCKPEIFNKTYEEVE